MEPQVDEIAENLFRISTFIPQIAAPDGFTFNQFLVRADQPLLFHAGPKQLYPAVSAAVARLIPLASLRWVAFGHFEADECGAMNAWLEACPKAEAAQGEVGCQVSTADQAARPPHPLADGEVLDLGGKRVRYLYTPHVPHGWDAGLLYEETTRTLLCGDLFTAVGHGPALVQTDLVEPALRAETLFQASCLTPNTAPTIRRLAALGPRTLAVMHGSSFSGDGGAALRRLADAYELLLHRQLQQAEPSQPGA